MKLSIVNVLVVFGLKLSANNVAGDEAVNKVCVSDEEYEFEFANELYTCARLALLKTTDPTAAAGVCNGVTITSCKVECDGCPTQCADSTKIIPNFKKKDRTCAWVNEKKTKKIAKYCRKFKDVVDSCPLTCDACVSNAPTDVFICEDSSFTFTYTADDNPTSVKYTCESLDKKYNAPSITAICKGNTEIKAMCPLLCDNCKSASPSAISSAPSNKPSNPPTACGDRVIGRITYERGTVNNKGKVTFPILLPDSKLIRKNKKCKDLAKENKETIVFACKNGAVIDNGLILIEDFCTVTCDNCGISSAPSISFIEPECYDNDNVRFSVGHSSGKDKGCVWLRNHPAEIAKCCAVGNGGYLNCKETCDSCDKSVSL